MDETFVYMFLGNLVVLLAAGKFCSGDVKIEPDDTIYKIICVIGSLVYPIINWKYPIDMWSVRLFYDIVSVTVTFGAGLIMYDVIAYVAELREDVLASKFDSDNIIYFERKKKSS